MDASPQASGAGSRWTAEAGAASYHDSPYGEPIEIGFVWTIARREERRHIRIEVARGAVYNDVLLAAVLRDQLDNDQPPERILISPDGTLRLD